MLPTHRGSAIAALVSLHVLASCSASSVTRPRGDDGQASLVVTVDVSATSVATVVVEVTAPDITTPLVFNIPIANSVASGTVTIPAGSDRTITIRAFDAGGVQTHSGSVTANVQSGTNPSISIVLTPLTGDVPINATLGSTRVAVTPTPNSISIGGSVKRGTP